MPSEPLSNHQLPRLRLVLGNLAEMPMNSLQSIKIAPFLFTDMVTFDV